MSTELACTYAALILNDDGVAVTADKISTLLKAANVEFEPFWPGLFAKAVAKGNINNMITNPVSSGAAAPAAGGAAPAAAAAAPAAKKEEAKKPAKKESSEEEMGLGLFD